MQHASHLDLNIFTNTPPPPPAAETGKGTKFFLELCQPGAIESKLDSKEQGKREQDNGNKYKLTDEETHTRKHGCQPHHRRQIHTSQNLDAFFRLLSLRLSSLSCLCLYLLLHSLQKGSRQQQEEEREVVPSAVDACSTQAADVATQHAERSVA